MAHCILIVDDEEDLRELFSQVVAFAGHKTLVASGGIEAFEIAKQQQVDAVLTDIRMPKGDGAQLLKNLKGQFPNLPVFVMSGYNDYTTDELINMGAKKVFTKPFNYEEFLHDLASALNT